MRFLLAVFFLISSCILNAQQVGTWRTYLAAYTTNSIAETNNYVYAVADGTLYRYGKNDNSLKFYSKQTGLSDTEVNLIAYNSSVKKLLLVYSNGNIDIMDEDDNIGNVPFIKNAGNIQNKTVYSVYFNGETAYIATGFGIWVYKMDKGDTVGTYLLSTAYGVTIRGEYIYASSNAGIQKAALKDNLFDPNNWLTLPVNSPDFSTDKIRELCLFENNICFRANTSGIYYLNANDEVQTLLKKTDLTGMKLETGYLIPHTSSTIYLYESISKFEAKNLGTVNDISGLTNNGNFWIASGENGLIGVKRKAGNEYEVFVSDLNIAGPKRNLSYYMVMHGEKLLVVGGGQTANGRFENPGTLMVYENEKWINFDETQVRDKIGYSPLDYMDVAVDPNDENHYFIGSFGEGIIEIKDNRFVELYNHTNSSLQTSATTNPNRYVRVCGATFDKEGYLWATNSEVTNGIVRKSPEGEWESFYFSGLSTSYEVDKILITSKGDKWVNVPRSKTDKGQGLLIFNDEGSHFETNFKTADSKNSIRSKKCLSMAEDASGQIWIGTAQGPIICSAPQRAVSNPDQLYFRHIILNDANEEAYIFLENEQINAIAIDGGDRKWLGTAGGGIYLVSPDGLEIIHHFTAENSSLLSNTVQSVVINHKTGEVFIGTNKGLVSYQSEATEAGSDYSDVYAYPNPVRPDFDDQVVITGLMIDSNVKITDLSGNLIYQGKSAGGQMVWNCRSHGGNRVATGIYLVLSSTPKAKESVVTKIAVVK